LTSFSEWEPGRGTNLQRARGEVGEQAYADLRIRMLRMRK
jgi:hypothetical protein